MSSQSRAAVAIWRARKVRAAGDRPYLLYLIFMVALVAVAPVCRAVWLSTTSPEGLALLTSPAAPTVAALFVAILWAGALLLGRDRGPTVLPPFLTYALASSALPRTEAFRNPLLRSGALVISACTITGGVIGASLASNSLVDPLGAIAFTTIGLLVGIITTMAWLTGQVFPRAAIPVALGILLLAGSGVAFPVLQTLSQSAFLTPVALTGLAIALVAATPSLMNRLAFAELMAQAARWDSATTHAAGMDFGTAASIYQRRPHVGRRIRAVRPLGSLMRTFLVRDAVGAIRTPGRLFIGVLAVTAAGVLFGLAFVPPAPGWMLGAAAGVIAFAGLGPLSDGIRHAANVAADFPLYGISDERLLASHSIFPLITVVIVLVSAAAGCAIVANAPLGETIVGSLALGLLAIVVRIGNALKGPLPPVLLTPIPTPMGDPMAAVRITWALDGVVFAAVGGAAAAVLSDAPIAMIGVAGTVLVTGIRRWRHRR